MKAFEWIDRVKSECGLPSDYAAAKRLGISKQAISTYRAKGSTLDEDASIVVATTLGMPPAGVILDQAAERVKSPEVRATLLAEAKRLCILCLITKARQSAANFIARQRKRNYLPQLTTKCESV
ncbi:MAG: hypothetical protein JSS77_16270 [Acidobacteria bacterium]|nr:hypothetical protein [Acidobacteriota bacterium]